MRPFSRIAAVCGAAIVAVSVLLVAAPATAHNYLVASTPTEGSTLNQLPDEFSVTTNDTLLDLAGDGGGFAIHVVDSAGGYYGDGCFTIRDESLATTAALGEAGDYRMLWQLVSADGHTVSGEVGFTWQPDSDQPVSEALSAPPVCGGGTLENSGAPQESASDSLVPGDGSELFDAETTLLIVGAIGLVLIAGVAIFLIAVRRKSTSGSSEND